MRFRCLAGLLGLTLVARSADAQETSDQARLLFTVGAGYIGGGSLWQIPNQAVSDRFGQVDTFALIRRVRPALGVGFSGTYFPGDHLGYTAEVFLMGLGTEDRCNQKFSSGSAQNTAVCQSMDGSERSSTAASISAGVVYRVASHQAISPYGRFNLGVTISQQSKIRLIGNYVDVNGTVDKIIYSDQRPTQLTGYAALGVGLSAAVAKGYQFRMEARDNYIGLQRVKQAGIEGMLPPHGVRGKHIFSLLLGFDVVLERRRGKRY